MGEFRTECPKCGQHLEASDEWIGQVAECPTCNEEFTISRPDEMDQPIDDDTAPSEETVDDQVVEEPTTTSDELESSELDPAEVPDEDRPARKRLGKNLMAAAGAAASEAKRGARIAGLKTQIEKLRRVDLQRAYRELGQSAYRIRFETDTNGQAYAEIEALDAQIEEKRAGVHADEHSTIADKAKAAAATAKMKAEAEVLAHRRSTEFSKLGERLTDSRPDLTELHERVATIDGIQAKVSSLQQDVDGARNDLHARHELSDSISGVAATTVSVARMPAAPYVIAAVSPILWIAMPFLGKGSDIFFLLFFPSSVVCAALLSFATRGSQSPRLSWRLLALTIVWSVAFLLMWWGWGFAQLRYTLPILFAATGLCTHLVLMYGRRVSVIGHFIAAASWAFPALGAILSVRAARHIPGQKTSVIKGTRWKRLPIKLAAVAFGAYLLGTLVIHITKPVTRPTSSYASSGAISSRYASAHPDYYQQGVEVGLRMQGMTHEGRPLTFASYCAVMRAHGRAQLVPSVQEEKAPIWLAYAAGFNSAVVGPAPLRSSAGSTFRRSRYSASTRGASSFGSSRHSSTRPFYSPRRNRNDDSDKNRVASSSFEKLSAQGSSHRSQGKTGFAPSPSDLGDTREPHREVTMQSGPNGLVDMFYDKKTGQYAGQRTPFAKGHLYKDESGNNAGSTHVLPNGYVNFTTPSGNPGGQLVKRPGGYDFIRDGNVVRRYNQQGSQYMVIENGNPKGLVDRPPGL